MKVKHYNEMMAYLTRPGFNGGGSVSNNTVLPKRKPAAEVKKRKKINYEKIKQYLGKESQDLVERELGFAIGGGVSPNQLKQRFMEIITSIQEAEAEEVPMLVAEAKDLKDKIDEINKVLSPERQIQITSQGLDFDNPLLDAAKIQKTVTGSDIAKSMQPQKTIEDTFDTLTSRNPANVLVPDFPEGDKGTLADPEEKEDVFKREPGKRIATRPDNTVTKASMQMKGSTNLSDMIRDVLKKFDKEEYPEIKTEDSFADGGDVDTPKRGLVDEPGSYAGNQGKGGNKLAGGEATKAKYIAQRAEMDKWLNNWLDNNFKNYGVRDKEKYLKDLKKDFKKAKKTQFKNNSVAQSGDLPTVSPRKTVRKKDGKIIGFFDNKNFFKMFDESLLVSQANSPEKDRFYKRLFYAGQIDTNPKLKKDIDNYFKTIALNKGRGFGFTEAELKKAYEVIASNPDVPYMLSSDAEINASMKQTLFEKRFKSYKPYREKVSAANINYKKNIKNLEKITGIPITKQIKKEHNSLKKILDISTLPDELKYSIDHLYGVSEAVKNPKNKKFATEVANNLIGGTAFQNTNAGFGGYSVKRKSLINNINEGKNVTKSLNRLNELTAEFYPKFKNLKQPYKIVNGELTFAKGFKGETQSERFTSYAKEIDKTKQGKQLIKKQYGSLKNLLKVIGCGTGKSSGGRIGFQDGATCERKGIDKINKGNLKDGSEMKNFSKLVNTTGAKTVQGVLKTLGSLGIAFEAGLIGLESAVRMGMGDTFSESIKYSTDYLVPGNQTLSANMDKISRELDPGLAKIYGNVQNYYNKQQKLKSFENQKAELENLNASEFDYLPDASEFDSAIETAKKDLDSSTVTLEEELFSERALDEASDSSKAKSFISNQRLKATQMGDVGEDISGLNFDLRGIETQPERGTFDNFRETMSMSQEDLLNVYNDAYFSGNYGDPNTEEARKEAQTDYNRAVEYLENVKNAPLSKNAAEFGLEQTYGFNPLIGSRKVNEPMPYKRQSSYIPSPQQAEEQKILMEEMGRLGAAGGGIAKLAGDRSGKPPESGPTPQGLASIIKRGRKY